MILGLEDRLYDVAHIRHDTVGLDLSDELLPQRIRSNHRRHEIPES